MKTQQYYKNITFTFIKIFDIKLATLKHGTGKFCSWQMICKFCRHIKCPYKCRLCIMKPLIKYIKKVLHSVKEKKNLTSKLTTTSFPTKNC